MSDRQPTYANPGQPEGVPWWHPLAYLTLLFGAGLIGWAAIVGVVWLAWYYFVAASVVLIVAAVVVFCVWLAVKGNARSRALAAGIFTGLVLLVLWAVQ